MNKLSLVIDNSSDEENNRYSTPIKTLPLNMVGKLHLGDSSTEVMRGSEANPNSSTFSISTFESNISPKKLKISSIKKSQHARVTFELDVNSVDDNYEESDTPSPPPALQPAPILEDVTQAYGYNKQTDDTVEKLNDLFEPEIEQIEKDYGISLDNPTMRCNFGGRGINYTSKRITRNRRKPILIAKEIPHCGGVVATRSRGALSQPTPGWCTYCQQGIHRQAKGMGHGYSQVQLFVSKILLTVQSNS